MKNKYKRIVGVDDAEGPPVPIPNTEVKLSGAENTWLVTARENREMPTHKSVHPTGWAFFYALNTLNINYNLMRNSECVMRNCGRVDRL